MKALRPFALLLQRERIGLIDAEHGLVIEAAPLAAPLPRERGWCFDAPAAEAGTCRQLFTHADFPLAEYFDWFLGRIYPIRKQRLMLVSNLQQPLSQNLWQHLFAGLGLRVPLQMRSPLQCLADRLANGLLVYCEDGLAQLGVFHQRQAETLCQVGYGFYLARAIRHHVQARHGLQIDAVTADQAWMRLGAEGQLTIQGRDDAGKIRRQLLIAEDLDLVFAEAIAPLAREMGHLQSLYPSLPTYLLGPQAGLPWLPKLLAAVLPLACICPSEPETLLQAGIQDALRRLL